MNLYAQSFIASYRLANLGALIGHLHDHVDKEMLLVRPLSLGLGFSTPFHSDADKKTFCM